MRRGDRFLFAAGALAVAVYFFRLARPSLHVYFSPDDSMNLYRAWSFPTALLAKSNLLFFLTSPFIRPMAAVWYRAIFHYAGFQPQPFHIANLVILLINAFLTYALARRLAGSREIGAVAALVGCYTTRLDCLYFDTGYIFDVLCYAFYYGAFLVYVRARQGKRGVRARDIVFCCALYICALNSKEMAVTLPLFLAIYELLFHGPTRAGIAGPLATGILTVAFAVGRSLGPDSLLTNDAYRPSFTWARFMETSRHFFGDFTASSDWHAWSVLLVWIALLGIALLFRSRLLLFGWLILMLGPIPVAFVYPRGVAQYYLTWFGWVLYASVVLVRPLQMLTRRFWGDPWWLSRARGAALVTVLILILYPYYKRQGWENVGSVHNEAPVYRDVVQQVHALAPRVAPRSRLLFLDDPVKPDVEDMLFLMRLSYRDDTLVVDRVKRMKEPPGVAQIATYNYVFDYRKGRFSLR